VSVTPPVQSVSPETRLERFVNPLSLRLERVFSVWDKDGALSLSFAFQVGPNAGNISAYWDAVVVFAADLPTLSSWIALLKAVPNKIAPYDTFQNVVMRYGFSRRWMSTDV